MSTKLWCILRKIKKWLGIVSPSEYGWPWEDKIAYEHGTCKDCEHMKKDKFGHHCCKCHWCVMDSYKDMMEHFYYADFEKRGSEND